MVQIKIIQKKIPETSVRALLMMVADIKKAIKTTPLTDKDKDKLYTRLHDILGEILLINYSHSKKILEGGGTNGRTL